MFLQQSFDAAVQALVIVLASDPHKMALLFEWALAKDVNSNNTFNMNNNNNNNNNNEPDVLFGESSTSAALARIYFPIIGGPHLANGLGSMILDICSHPAIYKVFILSAFLVYVYLYFLFLLGPSTCSNAQNSRHYSNIY